MFINICNCAWKPGFLKSSHIIALASGLFLFSKPLGSNYYWWKIVSLSRQLLIMATIMHPYICKAHPYKAMNNLHRILQPCSNHVTTSQDYGNLLQTRNIFTSGKSKKINDQVNVTCNMTNHSEVETQVPIVLLHSTYY